MTRFLLALLAPITLFAVPDAGAQGAAPARRAAADSVPLPLPDVSATATVRARTIRWEQPPRVEIRARACPLADTVARSVRSGLPDPIVPGVVYRDVRVDATYGATLDTTLARLAPGGSCAGVPDAALHESPALRRPTGVRAPRPPRPLPSRRP